MKNTIESTNSTNQLPEICEFEVFEILSADMKTSYVGQIETKSPSASKLIPRTQGFKSTTKLPDFTNDSASGKNSTQSLMQEIIILEEEIKFLKLSNTQLALNVAQADKNTELANLETKDQLAKIQSELFARQNQIETLKIELKRNQGLSDVQLRQLTSGNSSLSNENTQLRDKVQKLTEDITALRRQENILQAMIDDLKIHNKGLEADQINSEKMIGLQATTILEQTSKLASAIARVEQLTLHLSAQEEEIAELKTTLQITENNYATSQHTISKLTDAVKAGKEESLLTQATYEARLEEIKQAHNELTLQSETQHIAKMADQTTELKAILSTTVQQKDAEIADLKMQLATSSAQQTTLAECLAHTEAQAKLDKQANQDRMKKLNAYFVHLEQTKMKFQKAIVTLNAEIKAGINLHPLKDYYNLTCKEVVRVEIELKKTPTSSTHRRPLERAIEQLITQREYLKAVIDRYEADLSQKQMELAKLNPMLSIFDFKK